MARNKLEEELAKNGNQVSGVQTGSLLRTFMNNPERYGIVLVEEFSLRNSEGTHTIRGVPIYATESLRVLRGIDPLGFSGIGETTGYMFSREGSDMVTGVYVKDEGAEE